MITKEKIFFAVQVLSLILAILLLIDYAMGRFAYASEYPQHSKISCEVQAIADANAMVDEYFHNAIEIHGISAVTVDKELVISELATILVESNCAIIN